VPSRHWRLAFDILADLCFRATFPPEEVEREREVIVNEILAALDDPEEMSHDLMLERIWPGDPLSLPIAGTEKDVRAAARGDLVSFRDRMLRPELLLVTAAGPMAGNDIATYLSDILGKLSVGPTTGAFEINFPEPGFKSLVGHVRASISQAHLLVSAPLHPPFEPKDYYALSVLNGAFGESMSSRLFQRLREREGLCYAVASGFSMGRTEGLWVAQASSSPKDFPALLASMLGEMDDIRGPRPLSNEELSESISRVEGSYDLALEDTEFRMKRMARQAMQAGEVLDAEETRARILGVDRASVSRMTERVFGSGERSIFAYGNLGPRGTKALATIDGGKARRSGSA